MNREPSNLERVMQELDRVLPAQEKEHLRNLGADPMQRAGLHWSLGSLIRNQFIYAGNAKRHGLGPLATANPDGFSSLIIDCYLRHVRSGEPAEGLLAALGRVAWREPDDKDVMETAVSLLGEDEVRSQSLQDAR
ncbi:MAG: DUF6794 domain-containing protein [Rhodanobacteraceae bacterium]